MNWINCFELERVLFEVAFHRGKKHLFFKTIKYFWHEFVLLSMVYWIRFIFQHIIIFHIYKKTVETKTFRLLASAYTLFLEREETFRFSRCRLLHGVLFPTCCFTWQYFLLHFIGIFLFAWFSFLRLSFCFWRKLKSLRKCKTEVESRNWQL